MKPDDSRPFEGRPWAQTVSGRGVPLVDPTPDDIHWPDMAFALANINRFGGHAGVLSVAQHSIEPLKYIPHRLRPYFLLHDGHEYAIGDMASPTKRALIWLGADVEAFTKLKAGLDKAIYAKAGLPWPLSPEDAALIKEFDEQSMATEKRDVLGPCAHLWSEEGIPPFEEPIIPWSPEKAEREFMRELQRFEII